MAGLSQKAGDVNLSVLTGDDLSFDMSFVKQDGTGIDLTSYLLESNIFPNPTTEVPSPTAIPITITAIDLLTGKLHFFISKESVAGLSVIQNKHRWEFAWSYPNPNIPLSYFRRTAVSGYFSLEDN